MNIECKTAKSSYAKNFLQYMDYVVHNKRYAGKEGTARLYEATRNRFALFCQNRSVSLKGINAQVVNSFEMYLQSNHLSVNSVTNYMSVFRSMYNCAVTESLVHPATNPFQQLKLRPVSTHKRAVTMDVIMDIVRLDLKSSKPLSFARDLFLFSFMACGMTFVDMSHLTKGNIVNNTIIYRRVKTKTEIRVSITTGMRRLIDKYKDMDDTYLFPILKKDCTYTQYKVALRTYNRRLERIASMLPYEIKLTSYVARHSWAMRAKENNLSVTMIGEALGHTSEKTTRFYLSSLDQSILDKANKKIVSVLDKWIIKPSWGD
ncbi:tyrosine-type recombinase/integrase [Parabacteroides bouchesdurhonensis]|uniref:tyrosine-type recombinase/integrase n=1 Tax=Parabacteroides bouchesdurhonensis TaxID=1936995 RepID=UPI000C8481C6|nr:site-specific integrase [Parabacteroides bouchesdurhonensis]